MNVITRFSRPARRLGWISALLLLGSLFFAGGAVAQEEPNPTPTASASPQPVGDGTAVFLEVEKQEEGPVNKGDTFLVHVLISEVEDLSAFTFEIGFDPERIRPVPREGQVLEPTPIGGTPSEDSLENVLVEGETGQFLADSARNSLCTGPSVRSQTANSVSGGCAGVNPPVCLGGPPGVSGSGTLATVMFESRGGELTQLALGSSVLSSADADPCDPETDIIPIRIDHEIGSPVSVELAGGGGSAVLLIVIIVVIVLIALGGGVGGYLFYRQRLGSQD